MATKTVTVTPSEYIEVHGSACFVRVVGAGSVAVEFSDTKPDTNEIPSDNILDGSPLTYKGESKVWMKSRSNSPVVVKVVFE